MQEVVNRLLERLGRCEGERAELERRNKVMTEICDEGNEVKKIIHTH